MHDLWIRDQRLGGGPVHGAPASARLLRFATSQGWQGREQLRRVERAERKNNRDSTEWRNRNGRGRERGGEGGGNTGKMASLQIETGTAASATKPPPEQLHEMTSISRGAVPPGVVQSTGDFSEAIDRIGLGPFQKRLAIMCGMVSLFWRCTTWMYSSMFSTLCVDCCGVTWRQVVVAVF